MTILVKLSEIEVSQRGLRHPECVIGILQTLVQCDWFVLEPITLIPYPGKWVLSDGHHRAVAMCVLNSGMILTEGVHFLITPYDKKFKKRTFGSIADLIRRVTYATSSTRKTPASLGEHPKS